MSVKRERDTASAFSPTPEMVRIAADRTRAITKQWACEIVWKPADFMVLAESCYMQGMNDMIDAALRAGWIPNGTPAPEAKHFGDLP